MKKYLEYKDEKSHKFWAIEVKDNSRTVTYGKVGSKGRSSTKTFDTAEAAQKDAEKMIKAKIKEGYKEGKTMNHQGSTFICGCAPFTDMVFFVKSLDEMTNKGVTNSSFFLWDEQIKDKDKRWMKYSTSVGWLALTINTIKMKGKDRITITLGKNGEYFELNPVTLNEETGVIQDAKFIRSSKVIENTLYACGMDGLVIKRKSLGNWDNITPTLEGQDTIFGFEDISGFSEDEIYAVGWKGEIWRYNGKKWFKINSPTTKNLNAITCAKNGVAYIVGDNGIMLQGRQDSWEILDTERHENLWDVCNYNGEVFVSTDFNILTLDKNNKLINESRFVNDDSPTTCHHLLLGDDGVVSMGGKDLFRYINKRWERVV